MKLLVCISDYKTVHRKYLWLLFYEFNKMHPKYQIDIHVDLTDPLLIKEMGNFLPPFDNIEIFEHYHAESMGYDITFCHRKRMIEEQDNYDLFLYVENDILYTQNNIDAFVEEVKLLPLNYIPGFLYYERKPKPDKNKYILSFSNDWHPEGICKSKPGKGEEEKLIINNRPYATVYNLCQGSYLLTKNHLKQAINSGGYLIDHHTHIYGKQPYGIPETAAASPYSLCGMKKVIPLYGFEHFLIQHLRNYYVLNYSTIYSDNDFLNHYFSLEARTV
jgi:hypothetical protein